MKFHRWRRSHPSWGVPSLSTKHRGHYLEDLESSCARKAPSADMSGVSYLITSSAGVHAHTLVPIGVGITHPINPDASRTIVVLRSKSMLRIQIYGRQSTSSSTVCPEGPRPLAGDRRDSSWKVTARDGRWWPRLLCPAWESSRCFNAPAQSALDTQSGSPLTCE